MGFLIVFVLNIIAFGIAYLNCYEFNQDFEIYLVCFNVLVNILYLTLAIILYIKTEKMFLYFAMLATPMSILADYVIFLDMAPFMAHHTQVLLTLSLLFMSFVLVKYCK